MLRKRAEKIAREKAAGTPDNLKALSPEETQQLLHELQVHQIELEIQNEELRRTQTELGAAGARYFELYDLAPVGYVTISEKGMIQEANLTAANLLGVARSVVARQFFSWFILNEDRDIYYLHRKQLFETGEPQVCELRMVKENETIFWAHISATAAQDADCAPICRITISDITGLKQAEEDAARMARDWQSTFDATNDAIWILDQEQRVLRSNKTAERFFHLPCSDLIGKHCWEIIHGSAKPISECPLLRARESLRRETMELQIDNSWFQVTVDPILDPAGQYAGAVHIVSDITGRKQTEEQIRNQLDELRRWHNVMLGREDRVMEIKREVNELCSRIGEPIRYPSQESDSADSEDPK